MKEYILSVICISIVGSLSTMLIPEGDGGGIKRIYQMIFGVCLILVCLYPIKSIILHIDELDLTHIQLDGVSEEERHKGIFESSYNAAQEQNLKDGIKTVLQDRFDIDGSEVSISLKFKSASDEAKKDGEIGATRELERVFVTLYGSAIFENTGEIESYLYSLLGCEIITAIG